MASRSLLSTPNKVGWCTTSHRNSWLEPLQQGYMLRNVEHSTHRTDHDLDNLDHLDLDHLYHIFVVVKWCARAVA